MIDLSNHGRDDQVDDQGYHGNHDDHGDDDAQGACGHMAFLLHELHDGVEEVGQQPRYEEGQQYFTEVVHGEQYTEYQQGNACPAYESVKCDFFVHCLYNALVAYGEKLYKSNPNFTNLLFNFVQNLNNFHAKRVNITRLIAATNDQLSSRNAR